MRKSYDELTIQDNFIFQRVMRNEKICKKVIERLLDIKIKAIDYPEEEKTINIKVDSKGIRLDVYVNDDKGTVFNIEMQTTKDENELAKRIRYYQALIDISLLDKGANYETLNNTYIIFICTFPFKSNRHKYTFKNLCMEDHNIELNDGTTKMFLCTKGEVNDIPRPLQIFLDYIDGQKPADKLTQEMDEIVAKVKNREDWRREYMYLELALEKERQAGLAQGIAQGLAQGVAKERFNVIINMLKEGMSVDSIAKFTKYTKEQVMEIAKKNALL